MAGPQAHCLFLLIVSLNILDLWPCGSTPVCVHVAFLILGLVSHLRMGQMSPGKLKGLSPNLLFKSFPRCHLYRSLRLKVATIHLL